MKKLFISSILPVLFVSQLTILSCTKTVTHDVIVTDTVTKIVTDTVTHYVPDNSVYHLLMGKQWIVDTLYNNYTGSNTGTIVYIRGGVGNIQNLDNYVVVFWPDGNQFFLNGLSYSTYPYSFKSADSTEFLVNNTKADYARIVKLDANYLTIYDSTNSALSYYIYKP